MRVVECQQGSPEWLAARCGNITASRLGDLETFLTRASKNGKPGDAGADRIRYSLELLAERLSGRAEEHYVSKDMENGELWEDDARTAYELERGVMVEQVGFVLHPTLDFFGASPDGLVEDDGGIEIKCPRTTTHLRWLLAGVLPKEHEPQVMANIACCERQWFDFVSYCKFMPPGLQLFIVRVPRDEQRIAEIERGVTAFDASLRAIQADLAPRIRAMKQITRPELQYDHSADFLTNAARTIGEQEIPV